MTHNLDATIYVYRHRETGAITALYSDDACAMNYRPDYEHVATLEPRMWIEHHFDDAIKEREACATICDEMREFYNAYKDTALLNGDIDLSNAASGEPRACEYLASAIRARGNQ